MVRRAPIIRRIGVFYPPSSQVDSDYWRFLPPNVTLAVARTGVTQVEATLERELERLRSMTENNYIEDTIARLMRAHPNAIAYACSSVSFIHGLEGDQELVQRMQHISGLPATTATSAINEALNMLGVRRIGLITPYPNYKNRLLGNLLEQSGFQVVGAASWDSSGVSEWLHEGYQRFYQLAKSLPMGEIEAIVIPCTSLATSTSIERLERTLDRVVITANQATIWHALRLAEAYRPLLKRGALFRLPSPIAVGGER